MTSTDTTDHSPPQPQHENVIEVRTCSTLEDVEREDWQALRGTEHPFLSWDFLCGLERTGCVRPERGWVPLHLVATMGGRLIAATPAYAKGDGMGDFSRDWGLQGALQQLGGRAYPKLVIGVPFSPVTGPRLLVAPGFDAAIAAKVLMQLAKEVVRSNDMGSIQVLYHEENEAALLRAAGLTTRTLVQYHWHNYCYQEPSDWLARLPGRKRKQIRKERRAPLQQDIAIATWRHQERLTGRHGEPDQIAELAYELYRTTCEKYMWGGTYLNRPFFRLLFEDENLSQNVELVTAERNGSGVNSDIVAGAINLASDTHLYGRYWGCHEEHRFLHFNVCLYHSIDECIQRGVRHFEGGAGGEHKVSRGFEPSLVYHSLWFVEERVHEALRPALQRDEQAHRHGVEHWRAERGLDRPEVRERLGLS